jgi:FkbM family methyltransferase
MKLFGRELSNTPGEVKEIYKYFWYFLRCFLVFRTPLGVIYHYLSRTSPKGGVICLRSGLKIHLSGHPDDVITVFVIFIRRDYGTVPPGGVVVDIGANIGVYSLYAAACGAGGVHAFEPNSEAFRQLSRNIRENHLDNLVRAHRLAVSGGESEKVKFPKISSMYNAIIEDATVRDYEVVPAMTLGGIIGQFFPGNTVIDLLKMDCEGSEYDILYTTGSEVFQRIREIRLEYHKGGAGDLLSFLQRSGYRKLFFKEVSSSSGVLWVGRKSDVRPSVGSSGED